MIFIEFQNTFLREEDKKDVVDRNTLEELVDSSQRHSSVVSILATMKDKILVLGQRIFHLRKKVRWMRMMRMLVMMVMRYSM